MLGACQDSEAVVVPVAEAERFRGGPGSCHVVTITVPAALEPPSLDAVTENVYLVFAVNPVTVAPVPKTAICVEDTPEAVTE